jgi:hypothetical protein
MAASCHPVIGFATVNRLVGSGRMRNGCILALRAEISLSPFQRIGTYCEQRGRFGAFSLSRLRLRGTGP